MTLVEQIRKELEPYHVEGFTAMCRPAPSMDQIERLIAEVERLEQREREAAEVKFRELLSAKKVTMVTPAMPESELIRYLQNSIVNLQVDRHRLESSLAQAREQYAQLKRETDGEGLKTDTIKDIAHRQGAEAMREAAEQKAYDLGCEHYYCGHTIGEAIHVLPVPAGKEI